MGAAAAAGEGGRTMFHPWKPETIARHAAEARAESKRYSLAVVGV